MRVVLPPTIQTGMVLASGMLDIHDTWPPLALNVDLPASVCSFRITLYMLSLQMQSLHDACLLIFNTSGTHVLEKRPTTDTFMIAPNGLARLLPASSCHMANVYTIIWYTIGANEKLSVHSWICTRHLRT